MSKVKYISVEEAAQIWQISERSVRNYCAQGRVEGALLEEKHGRFQRPHKSLTGSPGIPLMKKHF